MEKINEIFGICDIIEDNFLILEKETLEILSCEPEQIEQHTVNRVELLEKNKKLFDEIFEFCDTLENGEIVKSAVKNTAVRDDLSEEEKSVFDHFTQVYAVVHRIVNVDKQVSERIKREHSRVVEKIKEMNASHQSKVGKFYSASDTGAKKHLGNTFGKV